MKSSEFEIHMVTEKLLDIDMCKIKNIAIIMIRNNATKGIVKLRI